MPVEEGHIGLSDDANYCLCDAAKLLTYPYAEQVEALIGLRGEVNSFIIEQGIKELLDEDGESLYMSTGDNITSGVLMGIVSGLLTAWLNQSGMSVCRAVELQNNWLREAIIVDVGTILAAADE
jgi:hypothetical protein